MGIALLAAASTRRRHRGVLGDIDFSAQTPGSALASLGGITCVRSGANAQIPITSDLSQYSAAVAANTLRIQFGGRVLVEERRPNIVVLPRSQGGGAPWLNGNATSSFNRDAPNLGPDGMLSTPPHGTATRWNGASGANGNAQQITITAGQTYSCSIWGKRESGAGSGGWQADFQDTGIANHALRITATETWQRQVYTGAFAATSIIVFPCMGADLGSGALAMDIDTDMPQIELGAHPTSYVTGTREHDLLQLDTTSLRSVGRVKMELQTQAQHASSAFGSDLYLGWWDANNHIRVQQSSRKVIVTLNSVAKTLSEAIPTFSAADLVDYYVEAGPGLLTQAWVEINGTAYYLGHTDNPQAAAPSGVMQLLNNGTAAAGATALGRLRFYS